MCRESAQDFPELEHDSRCTAKSKVAHDKMLARLAICL